MKINIRQKILLSLSFILILLLGSSYFINLKFQERYLLKDIYSDIESFQIETLMLRRHEKDFLLRKSEKYIKAHQDETTFLINQINNLEKKSFEYNFVNFENLKNNITKYSDSFNILSNNIIKLENKKESFYKKHSSIEDNVLLFLKDINEDNFKMVSESNRVIKYPELIDMLNLQKEIGFKYNTGMLGEVRSLSHIFEEELKKSSEKANGEIQNVIEKNELHYSLSLIFLISCILFIAIFMYVSISRRFTSVLNHSEKMNQDGGLNIRFSDNQNDELSPILSNLNNLLDRIEQTKQNIHKNTNIVSESILKSKDHTDRAVKYSLEQNDMTQYIASAATEVESSITEISRNISMIVNEMSNLSVSAESGVSDVSISNKQLQNLVSLLNDSNVGINRLVSVSNEIEDVISIISDIAEQTNLLALNAAIEAARAGESGRGFAVVADEVRNLSKRTQDSTNKISGLVKNIQEQVSNVNELVSNSSKLGNDCSEKSIIAESNISIIIDKTKYISELTDSIASAISQQQVANSEIGEKINRIKDNSIEIKDEFTLVQKEFLNIENNNNLLIQSTNELK